MTQIHQNANTVADAIIQAVGPHIVLGLPLGIGKAVHIANALFARAAADRSIKLTIFTALTLEKPRSRGELERRFLNPVIDRLFGAYPGLRYAEALRAGALPPNIEVNEFFFVAGQWLSVPHAQQNYISANYTHAARYLVDRGVNVIAQLVAKRVVDGETRFSLSSNTDMTLDLLRARSEGRANFLATAQVNSELPFMPGEGDLPSSVFSHVLQGPEAEFPLVAPPREPLGAREYAIGIHAARLVADGGTLQIGIGEEGDAAVRALMLRHQEPAAFEAAVSRLTGGADPLAIEHRGAFNRGLYGLSGMFVDGFLQLMDAGILKREVDGALLHAAFMLGPKSFYARLREMPPDRLEKLRMSAVSFTNEIYGNEEAKRHSRVKARFINNAMMATLLGAIVSDGLGDGRVVSGVGGQHNFVTQAFALDDARSIITLKSTRTVRGRTQSNIRWNYAHTTVPRHERDIVITEYGIADLRGRTDAEVVCAMLAVTDSRYQADLLRAAKDAGKIAAHYEIPAAFRDNTPKRVEKALAPLELPAFPFGTDFTPVEQELLQALKRLEAATPMQRLAMLASGLSARAPSGMERAALERMGLDKPAALRDWLYRALLRGSGARVKKS
jgi:acyl-CoA hydrolase